MIARAALLLAIFSADAVSAAAAQGAPPTPSPSVSPLTLRGYVRNFYFTRQNATNNPGVQFDYASKKCNGAGPCENQASFSAAISLHADYAFGGGWYAGGSYFYAQPFSGSCSVASAHAKGDPCVSQHPPNTNPDDTLPGFMLSTFPEAYLGYEQSSLSGKLGNQLFESPWAPTSDSRVKPAAYQGADLKYSMRGWTFEAAQMLQFEDRTSNAFGSSTLLTSHPSGASGLPEDIYVPGGGSITTPGFTYARAGYRSDDADYALDGYYYGISDIATMWWFDGRYDIRKTPWEPFVAMQGGIEYNSGFSAIGKIDSSVLGIRLGATPLHDVSIDVSFDSIPWRTDTITLAGPVKCSNADYQIAAGSKVYPGRTFPYFLPSDAGQCETNPNGTTTIYHGGWASPYTDNYSTDPFFTTQITQGMADRRSPGRSWRVAATYVADDKHLILIAGDAWFDYGNALASQRTNEWTLDGTYRFGRVTGAHYKGWSFRYRYAQRAQTNTACGTPGTICPPGTAPGTTLLGGTPLFKYDRTQLEYDF